MSRSRKKTPIGGHTHAESDKPYKVMIHRRERRVASERLNTLLHTGVDPEADDVTALDNDLGMFEPWESPKDGKSYWENPKAYRK